MHKITYKMRFFMYKICTYQIKVVILHRQTKNNNSKTFKTMKTNYTTKEINRNFKIKVFGFINGVKINTLVGVSGLVRILNGDEAKAQKFVARAFASGLDRTDCKVYGGVCVSFYAF